jgi:hypothetical protein
MNDLETKQAIAASLKSFADKPLVRQPRLAVMPLTFEQFQFIVGASIA